MTTVIPEDTDLQEILASYDLVFSMAQDEGLLTLLDFFELNGAVVINSAQAVRNCYRHRLSHLLQDALFSYPRFLSTDIELVADSLLSESPVWIKRGDFHALVDDDVVFARERSEKIKVLSSFKNRGVKKVIFQDHCEGELFKFYGVRDHFFHLRYMGRTTKDRHQFAPGDPLVEFDRSRLELLAHRAARLLELDFFWRRLHHR